MKVLVACEESQAVCIAFRERGHEAYSCDLLPCSGGHPEWHLQMDVFEAIEKFGPFDLMIAHPPCTFLSRIGQQHKSRGEEIRRYREAQADLAIEFIKRLWNCGIPKICIENPPGLANTRWKQQTQIVHPYYFGDRELKETGFWLKGLSRLNGLPHINKYRDKPKPMATRIGKDGKVKNTYFCSRMDNKGGAAKLKSKTFPSIARAMAEQWG